MSVHQKLKKILSQTDAWMWYGRISPLLFVLAAVGLYGIEHTVVPFILYGSWILLVLSSFIWWFWVIKVITEMTLMFKTVLDLVETIKEEIKDVHEEIKNIEDTRKN